MSEDSLSDTGVEMNAPMMAAIRSSAGAADDEMITSMMRAREAIMGAVKAALEPDRAQLRRPPETVAQMIMFLVFASRSGFGQVETLNSDELVSLLLDGVLVRESSSSLPGDS